MTIRTDLDAAIEAAAQHGTGLASMRLRMGLGARNALIADRGTDLAVSMVEDGAGVDVIAYCGIPIEAVEPPATGASETDNRFHGWVLECN